MGCLLDRHDDASMARWSCSCMNPWAECPFLEEERRMKIVNYYDLLPEVVLEITRYNYEYDTITKFFREENK